MVAFLSVGRIRDGTGGSNAWPELLEDCLLIMHVITQFNLHVLHENPLMQWARALLTL